jgi:hypothetical protein
MSLVSAPSYGAESPERDQGEDDALCERRSAVRATGVDDPDAGQTREPAVEVSVSSPRADGFQAMPESGKWCQDCAGLGLHIAALVAQMQAGKSRQALDAAESAKEKDAAVPEKKSSWKRTVSAAVLGSSSSNTETAKVKAEKVRLEEENAVLRATIEYLYQKVESLSPPSMVVD